MPDSDVDEQIDSAPAPAPAHPRRGRAIAAVAVAAVIGFIAIAHVTGALVPLLVLAGLAVLFALAALFRGLSHVSGLRGVRLRFGRTRRFKSAFRQPGSSRQRRLMHFPGIRRSGGAAGRRGGAAGSKARGRGLHLPGSRNRAGQRGAGLPFGRRGRGTAGQGGGQRRGILHRRGSGTGGKRAGGGRPTLGQRLHLPFANRRAARRQQGRGKPGSAAPAPQPRGGLFRRIGTYRAKRAARRTPAGQQQPKSRTGRVLSGIGMGLALPFAAPFALKRWRNRRNLRKAARGPHARAQGSRWQRLRGRLRRPVVPAVRTSARHAWNATGGRLRRWHKNRPECLCSGWPHSTYCPRSPRQRRKRREQQQAEQQPKPEQPDQPKQQTPAEPEVKPAVQRPPTARPWGEPKQPERITSMPAHISEATDVLSQIGNWEPESATDMESVLSQLPELPEALGQALNSIAEKLSSDYPVDEAVPEILRDAASHISGTSDQLAEVHSAFRSRHEDDLRRIEEPRPNEKIWDVTQQG
jgi:hypothetical protein